MFKDELNNRKTNYSNQKEIKDLLFQEIERDKTQLRIIENKADKSTKAKIIKFPFKSLAGITKAKIKSIFGFLNFIAIDASAATQPHTAVYFVIETSSGKHTSRISESITNPKWDDIFNISIVDELSPVNFRVYS
jgi:hypothetical protein